MSGYDKIIRNGLIVSEDGIRKSDIGIRDGTIAEIADGIVGTAAEEINAEGLHILPGLIDTHVHFNEPGRGEWEGLETGSQSLAAGGVTTFFDMPLNSTPPTTTPAAFDLKKNAADRKSIIDYRLWGGMVPENLDELEELHKRGVIGFKAFMSNSGIEDFGYSEDVTLFQGMQQIARLGSILAVHAESNLITQQLSDHMKQNGRLNVRDYCDSRPVLSEMEAVSRILAYAEAAKCRLHIVHASSGEVVSLISDAKKRGIDVTVETCPHYLSLTVSDFEELGPIAKCAPPLREQEHVDALWNLVKLGEVDIIGSDHSPSPFHFKKGKGIFEAWGGISGAQSTLNVLLEEGYWKRGVPLESIIQAACVNPARRFGLDETKGSISIGKDADLAIIDLKQSFTLKESDLRYRHKYSPYVGRTFRGKVLLTISNGNIVFGEKKAANEALS
ncbi:allantoinase [Mesobacillus foraminis]|uniref:allantoinase n=1 Tax=Mesobacillus foraminis TaxID=279826 RepID=UPI000EF467CE|nr:allantoinase [Mesobacillus foraminis]